MAVKEFEGDTLDEALEAASDDGGENSPLLPPEEAVALVHCADRRVGACLRR